MSHDPVYIGIVYKGPKRYRGSRSKTIMLPVGKVAVDDFKLEVTFGAPKFFAAVPAKYVAAMVTQHQFDYANVAQEDKHKLWLESKTVIVDGAPVLALDEGEEDQVIEVTPPTDDEIQREIDKAVAIHDYSLDEELPLIDDMAQEESQAPAAVSPTPPSPPPSRAPKKAATPSKRPPRPSRAAVGKG